MDHKKRFEKELEYIKNAGQGCNIEWFNDDHKPVGLMIRMRMKAAGLIYEANDLIHLKIKLTPEQRRELGELWFVYGNHGHRYSRAGHRFIQCFLEDGEDRRDFFKPSHELCQAVDAIMKRNE